MSSFLIQHSAAKERARLVKTHFKIAVTYYHYYGYYDYYGCEG